MRRTNGDIRREVAQHSRAHLLAVQYLYVVGQHLVHNLNLEETIGYEYTLLDPRVQCKYCLLMHYFVL